LKEEKIDFFILVDVGRSISNGLNNEANDATSLAGTTRSGAPTGWINVLATGPTAPGVSGQSTLSRKSGKKHPVDHFSTSNSIFRFSYISKKY
jgi:hypothetical protein